MHNLIEPAPELVDLRELQALCPAARFEPGEVLAKDIRDKAVAMQVYAAQAKAARATISAAIVLPAPIRFSIMNA